MKPLALLSVTDKTGIAEFAAQLQKRGFEILSTGNTAKHLQEAGVDVMGISYYTGMPEVLGGRVKTLHPKVHGGLLAKPNDAKHREEMEELNIRSIKLLAVNLYPFENTVLSGASFDDAIENIDIGGPAMIRAAAKNAENVVVVVNPSDYETALKLIENDDKEERDRLRAKAFAHTAFYDALIAEYLANGERGDTYTVGLRKKHQLRYGENPHQAAAVYVRPFETGGVCQANQIWGKEMSYNNYLDANAAWEMACDLTALHGDKAEPTVIVKHGNPCGAAWAKTFADSFTLARATDPISAFGGIVAVPGRLDTSAAEQMTAKGNFFEVVVCESISDEALALFRDRSGWGQNVRILVGSSRMTSEYLDLRTVRGGALVQDSDSADPSQWLVATDTAPSTTQDVALRSAWVCVKHIKSNAIAVCTDKALVGIGAGQMNRVQSVRLALDQASGFEGEKVLASDAFFPFPDSIEVAAQNGVRAIVQPGGSKKDDEVIAAANKHSIPMVLNGVRHFRH